MSAAHASAPERAAAEWLTRDLPPAPGGLCAPELLVGSGWRAKLPEASRQALEQAMNAEAPTLPSPWAWPWSGGATTASLERRHSARRPSAGKPTARPVEALQPARRGEAKAALVSLEAASSDDGGTSLDGLGAEGWVELWVPPDAPGGCPRLLLSGAPCHGGREGARCPSGALHGAVALLVEHFGLRYWAPGVTARQALPLPLPLPPQQWPAWPSGVRRRSGPAFRYRELYGVSANKFPEWAQAQHLHGGFDGGSEGHTTYVFAKPPGGVHTAFKLVPRSMRAQHPRWFGGDQLCWLADGLADHLLAQARRHLDEQAAQRPTVISISQDDNMSPCESGEDGRVAREEGSMMAPMLRTVNLIADALATSHSGVWVDTLAYQHTQRLPKTTRPRPNVLIRLATIFADFARPLDDPAAPTENRDFARDLRAWSGARRAQPDGARFRLAIWDYGVNFRHWLLPWPNWRSMAANLRFYAEQGVEGVFMEGNYKAPGGDLEPLKSYLYAQLMWEPRADAEALTAEFLSAYYGDAAGAIAQYIEHYSDAAVAAGAHMNIFAEPSHPLFTPDVVLRGAALMQRAQRAVQAAGGELARRARVASLSTRYTLLMDWQRLRRHCAAQAGDECEWPDDETTALAALANFERIYREAGMHEAFPPERSTPDPTSDIGLGESGNGLEWLRGLVSRSAAPGFDLERDLEREPPPRHAAFGHGPYTPPVSASPDLERAFPNWWARSRSRPVRDEWRSDE